MISNSNTFNAIEMTDADLDCVNGGTATIVVNQTLLKIKEELEAAYQKNHPIQLGPFAPPHTAVPHF